MVRRLVPVLGFSERFIRPRWATSAQAAQCAAGGLVLLLAASFLARVPLSNVPPALATGLITLAYPEDGVLLGIALAAAPAMLAGAAWEALSATGWVPGIR